MGNSNINDLSDIKTYSLKQKKEDIQDIFDKFDSDNQLTTEGISTKAVTTEKLNTAAVTTEKVADSAINSAKLASNAVTSAKIASNAVQSSQIASSAVTSGKISSGAITETKIAKGAVTSSKLGTDVENTLKEIETKLRKQVVSSLPSNTTTYNFEDGSSKFVALSKCVVDTTFSSTISTNDNNNKVQRITSNSSMGSSDNARAVLDLESVTDGAKKIIISFDFQFASNGRWHLSLCDLDIRETLDTVRYMNNGIALDIVSNSGNQVQVNGNSKTGTDWFGKWLTFNATIDLEHKRIESYLVSNGLDSISGSTIAFKDQAVERITGIELYTWVTNDVVLIDNVNITVQGVNENTLFMMPVEDGIYKTYTYIEGKPVLIGGNTHTIKTSIKATEFTINCTNGSYDTANVEVVYNPTSNDSSITIDNEVYLLAWHYGGSGNIYPNISFSYPASKIIKYLYMNFYIDSPEILFTIADEMQSDVSVDYSNRVISMCIASIETNYTSTTGGISNISTTINLFGESLGGASNIWNVSKIFEYIPKVVPDKNEDVLPEKFDSYSTTPQKIGTWIDGTPIWRYAWNVVIADIDKTDEGIDLTLPVLLVNNIKLVTNVWAAISPSSNGTYYSPEDILLSTKWAYTNPQIITYMDIAKRDQAAKWTGYIEFVTPESNINKTI